MSNYDTVNQTDGKHIGDDNNNDKNNDAGDADDINSKLNEVVELGSTDSSGKTEAGGHIRFITIVGQVEGHYMLGDAQKSTKYEHLIPLLADAEENPDIDGLLILINTMGGDVEAGLAIAELISGVSKPSASVVLGGGHSIGVPLAVAADRSFIVPSATMTIHPVRLNGTVIGVPQTYTYFLRMQERIVSFITAHSKIDADLYRKMMLKTDELANDMGSVIDGNEAVSCGLIDEIGSLSSALAWLKAQVR